MSEKEEKNNKLTIEDMATFCKKKGFIFRAAEIYGGLSGFFDFGPLGVELKNNIKDLYWKNFVSKRDDIIGQDGSIITNPKVWKASGHVDSFGDLVLTTKKTKTKIRADHFIEDTLNISADGMKADEINRLIKEKNLKYNGEDFEDIKDFNLMFSTHVGADTTKNSLCYLRPETCQSIFPNFKLLSETSRLKLPFGIAQIGKAFRNEISPRDFIFRCREFEQMEMEYFYNPETKCELLNEEILNRKFKFLSAKNQESGKEEMEEISINEIIKRGIINDYHGYWLSTFFNWLNKNIGLDYEHLRVREHVKTELSHYSSGTVDIDYKFNFGFKEILGLANRGNFDLTQHQKFSKSKLEFFDDTSKKKFLPNVIEPSLGVERLFMAVIYEAYNYDEKRKNVVLKFKPKIAPVKVAVLPLMNKEELIKPAKEIVEILRDYDLNVIIDKSGSIGKRYARYDEIGVPFCITIDYETIENGEKKDTITIRDRNTTEQKRFKINEIGSEIISMIKEKKSF